MHWGRNGSWGSEEQEADKVEMERLPCELIVRPPAIAATGRSKHCFCSKEPFLMSQSVSMSMGILGTRVRQR